MVDQRTEWAHGSGAVKTVGKIIVTERGPSEDIGVETGNVVIGVVIAPDGKGLLSRVYRDDVSQMDMEESVEMWEVEMIIIPKRKYRKHSPEEFVGLNAAQMLSSAWWSRSAWKEQIFPIDS